MSFFLFQIQHLSFQNSIFSTRCYNRYAILFLFKQRLPASILQFQINISFFDILCIFHWYDSYLQINSFFWFSCSQYLLDFVFYQVFQLIILFHHHIILFQIPFHDIFFLLFLFGLTCRLIKLQMLFPLKQIYRIDITWYMKSPNISTVKRSLHNLIKD